MLEGENNHIKQAQKGNSEGFGALYDHYMAPIYRFILMKVSSRQEAEDLAHDVFMSAWQNIHSYTPQGHPFSSWLYQIARNKVIDHYRLKKPTADIENIDSSFIKVLDASEQNIDFGFNLVKVRQAITKLTPDQQDVVIMRFIEDLTHQEIAAALERSEGAVRLLQHRAINNLKSLLEESESKDV